MEESSNSSSGFWIVIFVIALIWAWYQNDKLTKQVNAYKEQSSAYEQCVGDYQSKEREFIDAIENASSDLDTGGTYEYRNAQDELSIDTSKTNCDIPSVPGE